ncbi:FAD/NAD(P)-dependent oxidoreductase [Asticcacaulis endophyticus]|uniref:FAD/NAD(P)-binding oxidoreductase n=1 Tax=Asticcacaulis endophyticus TaxID=1395890 RepID=A0A918USZ5_9CAUL|nr:NAD(P)/FAD-dependent oxidoreductase [Asticcacaulis endophyticus]GGZ31134.1 FAD/NAD(P)-binding oxidoreductase [Asticcacaulis endophyticus]
MVGRALNTLKVVIIGAGPAGVRAAQTLVAAGVRPTVIDEGRRAGGQIYRRQPDNFTRSLETLYGTEASRAQGIHDTFDGLVDQIDYLPETLVWNISDGRVFAVSEKRETTIEYDALIICSGATDRLMPVKGWDMAGVYSLGGSQVALKSQAVSIGQRVIFMGTGPLLYLVASQYLKAGAGVVAVLDTSSFIKRVVAAPKLMSAPDALINGLKFTLALKAAGVPVLTGIRPLEITGDVESGVSGLIFETGAGEHREIKGDAVAMGYHLRPETQLADLTRCEFAFDEKSHLWYPKVDEDGRATTANVYLAGDGARILGARAAEVSGKLAALACLKDAGAPVLDNEIMALRQDMACWKRFATGLREAFPWPAEQAAKLPDETVVCRCEAITAGELRRTVNAMGAKEANRAKAFSRVGMGRCQGRYCALAGAEIIAAAAGIPVSEAGRLRGQAPVKPLPICIEDDEAAAAISTVRELTK